MQSGEKKWHISSESGRGGSGQRDSFWGLFAPMPCFILNPIQSVCPPSTNTLYELSLSRWSNPIWQTRSYSTGSERQSCSFSQIPTNTAAEKPLWFSGNSFETRQKLLARPPWWIFDRISEHCLRKRARTILLSHFWMEILSLLRWLERAAVKSPGKQNYLNCSACFLVWLLCCCTLQRFHFSQVVSMIGGRLIPYSHYVMSPSHSGDADGASSR